MGITGSISNWRRVMAEGSELFWMLHLDEFILFSVVRSVDLLLYIQAVRRSKPHTCGKSSSSLVS